MDQKEGKNAKKSKELIAWQQRGINTGTGTTVNNPVSIANRWGSVHAPTAHVLFFSSKNSEGESAICVQDAGL